jgi:hypothetical protein
MGKLADILKVRLHGAAPTSGSTTNTPASGTLKIAFRQKRGPMFHESFARIVRLVRIRLFLMRRTRLQPISLLLVSVAVLPLFPNAAYATMTEVFGGPGGGRFSMTCATGNYLVGFRARAGGWVEAIGLLCASFDATTNKVGANFTRERWTGGKGGTEQEVYCAPGEGVTGIGLAHTRGGGLERQYVNTVDIRCQHRQEITTGCISSGEGCGYIPAKVIGTIVFTVGEYRYDRLYCPSNEFATGIQGRSGIFIDAIGLICAPPPVSRVMRKTIKPFGKRKSTDTDIDSGGVVKDHGGMAK